MPALSEGYLDPGFDKDGEGDLQYILDPLESKTICKPVQLSLPNSPNVDETELKQIVASLKAESPNPEEPVVVTLSVELPSELPSELPPEQTPELTPSKAEPMDKDFMLRVVEHARTKSASPASSAASDLSDLSADGEEVERRPSRGGKRRKVKKVKVIETMGMEASTALQVVIDNHGKLEDYYHLEAVLGKGSFGIVRKGSVKATGAVRAIKSISMEAMKDKRATLKREIEIMKLVDHPSALMLYELFEDEENMHLVLNLCFGGCLTDRLHKVKRLPENETACMMHQVLSVVAYLHVNMICHRDLKADNILLTTSSSEPLKRHSVRVADFGLATTFKAGVNMTSMAGTPSFMSPEVFMKSYTHACDLWSCGVILYNALSGSMPFENVDQIKAGKYKMASKGWWDISQEAYMVVRGLLCNAKVRLTAAQILSGKWMQDFVPSEKVPSCPDLKHQLEIYRKLNRFKQGVLCMAATMMDENDAKVQDARALFTALDANGDGRVKLAELLQFIKRQSLRSPAHRSVSNVSLSGDHSEEEASAEQASEKEHDAFKDFTFTEFLAAIVVRKQFLSEECLRCVFEFFDRDHSGSISMAELASGHLMGAVSMEELAAIIGEVDKDSDENIDWEEFLAMMRHKPPPNPHHHDNDHDHGNATPSPVSNSTQAPVSPTPPAPTLPVPQPSKRPTIIANVGPLIPAKS